MTPVAMTFVSTASEPTELEARAHAIKNCVSVILGLASTIERHVDPGARPRVTQLMNASRCLKTLLTQQHPQPDAATREKFRVADVLQCVVDRLGPQAEGCLVQLSVDCAGGTLVGEFAELAEALYNLASNALLASPPGSMVRIATRTSAEGDHEWTITDAGCGIPASMIPRLGTVGVTTRSDGTGLGLSLALQVVTRHHGIMRIESLGGSGTTVTVWLPASPTKKA